MKRMTVGFVFSDDLQKVYLVKKLRPESQYGLLNGIGGHCKSYEFTRECFIREVKEEAGVVLDENDILYHIGLLRGKDWIVDIFTASTSKTLKTMTDEEIILFDVNELDTEFLETRAVSNLTVLLPMARYRLQEDVHVNLVLEY